MWTRGTVATLCGVRYGGMGGGNIRAGVGMRAARRRRRLRTSGLVFVDARRGLKRLLGEETKELTSLGIPGCHLPIQLTERRVVA